MKDLDKAMVWRQNYNYSFWFNGIYASSLPAFYNLVVNIANVKLYGDYTKELSRANNMFSGIMPLR